MSIWLNKALHGNITNLKKVLENLFDEEIAENNEL